MSVAGNSQGSQGRRRGPGRRFKPGQSGNPSGLTSELRARREAVRQALDKALVIDGRDLLVEAIVAGVQEKEPSLVRLACEYRWSKPATEVENTVSVTNAPVEQLEEQLPEALKVLGVVK